MKKVITFCVFLCLLSIAGFTQSTPLSGLGEREMVFYQQCLKVLQKEYAERINTLKADGPKAKRLIGQINENFNTIAQNKSEAGLILEQQFNQSETDLALAIKGFFQNDGRKSPLFLSTTIKQVGTGKVEKAIKSLNKILTRGDDGRKSRGIRKVKGDVPVHQLLGISHILLFTPQKTVFAFKNALVCLESEKLEGYYQLLSIHSLLGFQYQAIGNHKKAKFHFQKGIAIWDRLPNAEETELLLLRQGLTTSLLATNEIDQALVNQFELTAMVEEAPVDRPKLLADTYSQLAKIYIIKNLWEDALDIQLEALQVQQSIYPSSHRNILASYDALAEIYLGLKQYEPALDALKSKLLLIKKEELSSDLDRAKTYQNLAGVYYLMGAYEQGLRNAQAGLKEYQKVYQSPRLNLANAYFDLARFNQTLDHHDQALAAQLKGVEIQKQLLPEPHPAIASAQSYLGLIYYSLKDYDQALKYQQIALEIQQKLYQSEHPSIVSTYNNIAEIYIALGHYELALSAQDKALHLIDHHYEKNHPDRAQAYVNLAAIALAQEELDSALLYQQTAVELLEIQYGKYHWQVVDAYCSLANIYWAKKDYSAVIEALTQGLSIQEQPLDNPRPQIAAAYELLGQAYQATGNYEAAEAAKGKSRLIKGNFHTPKSNTLAVDNPGMIKRIITFLFEGSANRKLRRKYKEVLSSGNLTEVGNLIPQPIENGQESSDFKRFLDNRPITYYLSLGLFQEELAENRKDSAYVAECFCTANELISQGLYTEAELRLLAKIDRYNQKSGDPLEMIQAGGRKKWLQKKCAEYAEYLEENTKQEYQSIENLQTKRRINEDDLGELVQSKLIAQKEIHNLQELITSKEEVIKTVQEEWEGEVYDISYSIPMIPSKKLDENCLRRTIQKLSDGQDLTQECEGLYANYIRVERKLNNSRKVNAHRKAVTTGYTLGTYCDESIIQATLRYLEPLITAINEVPNKPKDYRSQLKVALQITGHADARPCRGMGCNFVGLETETYNYIDANGNPKSFSTIKGKRAKITNEQLALARALCAQNEIESILNNLGLSDITYQFVSVVHDDIEDTSRGITLAFEVKNQFQHYKERIAGLTKVNLELQQQMNRKAKELDTLNDEILAKEMEIQKLNEAIHLAQESLYQIEQEIYKLSRAGLRDNLIEILMARGYSREEANAFLDKE